MFFLIVVSLVATPAWAGKIWKSDGFEAYNLNKWIKSGNTSSKVVNTPTLRGNYSAKMQIRRYEDRYPNRTELRLRGANFEYNTEYWVGVNIYIPSDWQYDRGGVLVTQFHAVPDRSRGEKWRNPPVALKINYDTWNLAGMYDDEWVTTRKTVDGRWAKSLGKVKKGAWTSFVFRVKFSYGRNGILEVYKDGRKAFGRTGPNTYRDSVGPYLKVGLYKPVWGKNYSWKKAVAASRAREHTLFLDEVRIAVGSNGLGLVRP